MRDIDNDIRNSLERLTNPQGNTPGTEALWGDLVARRRKRRNRNRTLAALPLLLVAVIAVGILSTRDSTDSTRSNVAAGGADVSTPTVDDVQGSWGLRALIRNGEEHLTSNEAVLVIDGDEAVGDDGCGNDIRTRLQADKVTAPGFHSLGGCIDPDINDDANHLWHVLENEPTYKLRDGDLWLVTDTGDGLVFARRDAPEETTTGTLRVRNIQVFGNGPLDGGTERAVIVFNEAIPIEEVQYVHDIHAAAPGTGMAWTTQGPNRTHLCDSQHSVPDGAVGSVDLLVPASWFADADAHTVTELATIDNPAKFPICGPHNGFIQYAMWSPLSADPADVTVNVSSDRTTVTIEVASEGDVPLDPVAGQAVVADFLDRLRDDDVEGAAALWTGYPASQPNRPVSERVQYVELLAEYPPFARILDSGTTTTFVTPSLDNENAQVVTILDARSPNSPPVAVAFLTELHDEDGDERMWIQRLPPIDANATPELPNHGYVQPGERVVVPGLPVEGSVRGFVNGDEVPVEADLENETFTVIVPPEASGDIAVTFVVATPEEPIVRTFAATVR